MDYVEAVQFLYDLRSSGSKLGLENTRRLAGAVGSPQDALRFIHVAGTNGKGSVCAILESIYRAAGHRTGLYTSPHLVSFCERIRVDGRPIAESEASALIDEMRSHLPALAPDRPTFFEFTTVMALEHFRRSGCEIVIWETGLGGRLDSTNIVTPDASVITNISAEHQKWLGNTIGKIAREKAGIIKPGAPVFSAAEQPEVREVISSRAEALGSPMRFLEDADLRNPMLENLALQGIHQRRNAALALNVVHDLRHRHPVPVESVAEGLRTVRWAGRLQTHLQPDGSAVLLDGAHNAGGMRTLASFIDDHPEWQNATFIVGMLNDRSVDEIFDLLRTRCRAILFCNVTSDRSSNARDMERAWKNSPTAPPAAVCSNLEEALLNSAGENRRIITGSLHFIGEAMEKLSIAPHTATTNEMGLNDWTMR